ncbi:MAG: hypothetical protein GC136_11070 [Alphaproteobacteria bacterium]|nr:hypothetical protein [Alphaproteobacteria bacterium]
MQNNTQKRRLSLYWFMCLLVILQLLLWPHVRSVETRWLNIPDAPSEEFLMLSFLGDREMAYRTMGMTLQNMGDLDGHVTPIKDYDFEHLQNWFFLLDRFNSTSNFIPYLASFYFGATQNPAQLDYVIPYLRQAAQADAGFEKWRWLVQAMFLARHRQHDMEKALKLADELAARNDPDAPIWTKQMRAFIKADMGEKEAAYDIIIGMLKEAAEAHNKNVDPAEIFFMKDYICNRLLDAPQRAAHPLCQDVPQE